jgi:hypothetical protein
VPIPASSRRRSFRRRRRACSREGWCSTIVHWNLRYVFLEREREELREPASYFFAVDWESLVCQASIEGRLGTTTRHFTVCTRYSFCS